MNQTNIVSSKELYKRLLVRLIIAVVSIALLIFGLPKLVQMLSPFIIAFIGAVIIYPIATKINAIVSRINKNIMIPRKVTTFILNFLVLLVAFLAFYYLSSIIVKEVISLSSSIQQNWPSIVASFDELMERLTRSVNVLPPQAIDIIEDFKDTILVFIQDLSKNIVSYTVSTTASGITSTGTLIINLITFILALFFISSDFNHISDLVNKYTNERILRTLDIVKTSVVNAMGGYFKAQLILALIAFLFMFVALSTYRHPYAFIIALSLGLIDMLPIIGTIAVLVPWGVIEYVGGDIHKGIFLMLLGIAYFLIRRVIEPKIMGSQTGLHPLLVLLSTYVGLHYSGVWGALLGPVTLMLIISIAKSGIFAATVSDIRAAFDEVSALLSNDKR